MRPVLLWMILLAPASHAGELVCGTTPANDARVRAVHERTRARIASNALDDTRAALLREGAFYVQNDPTITPGQNAFDLHGRTLVFTPAGDDAFTLRREPLQYVEPAGAPLRDFNEPPVGAAPVAFDLGFVFPLSGRAVTQIHVDAYNGIHAEAPRIPAATQFDAIEAGVRRKALLSPLMLTANTRVPKPRVWIERLDEAVIVTWRAGALTSPFSYDVQARLGSDGTIAYSYASVAAMHWGTPIVSTGFDPAAAARTHLGGAVDRAEDVDRSIRAELRPMLEIRRADVHRIDGTDLFSVRITLAGNVDWTKLVEGEVLQYEVNVGGHGEAAVRITRQYDEVATFTSLHWQRDADAVTIDGNVIELYGVQRDSATHSVRVASALGSDSADSYSMPVYFSPAPRALATDLSNVAESAELALPIAEPFVLGAFDPYRVWDVVQTAYGLSGHDYDAVAMYQTYYTDLILYAGAYATGGNPQVDGIRPFNPFYGTHAAKAPTLLHMNQLAYGHMAAERTGTRVLLHELGHRWLYFFSIAEDGGVSSALNPVSPHPAAYVHTPSAFPVYGANESSVMGGAYFTARDDGSYVATAANDGFSWTDLYLMGLAAPDEVPPWFYLAGTQLPLAYWPPDGAIVTGQKREVRIGQVTAVHGPRIPSTAIGQRQFRVLFVLVTEDGAPTDAEVAKLNRWRASMERNFALATGGRGRLITTFVRPGKRRAS